MQDTDRRGLLRPRSSSIDLRLVERVKSRWHASSAQGDDLVHVQYVNSPHMLLPTSRFVVIKGTALYAIILWTVLYLPVQAAFAIPAEESVENICNVIYFVDIALRFRTGFVDTFDALCLDAKVVGRIYLRGWFVIDLLSALPYRSIADALFDDRHSSEYKFMSLLPLFRILRLKDGLSKFVEHVAKGNYSRLCTAMACFLLVVHWSACIFYGVARGEAKFGATDTWIHHNELLDADFELRYRTSSTCQVPSYCMPHQKSFGQSEACCCQITSSGHWHRGRCGHHARHGWPELNWVRSQVLDCVLLRRLLDDDGRLR